MRPFRARKRQFICEELESRQLLTGTWTTLSNAIPNSDRAQLMLLLGDGSVMIAGGTGTDGSVGDASSTWYKLTPNNGSYVNGTFTQLASMTTPRRFYGSVVLPSGKVMVVGGEYTGVNSNGNFGNLGEIYNPAANTWSSIANFPQADFGDDTLEVLPNGTVLGTYILGPQNYIYNPATNIWTATGNKLHNDRSDEESFVKLPDDSLLSYDIFNSISTGTPTGQRYIPSTGKWVATGNLPALLSTDNLGDELGPGFLLPDGRAMFFGSTGATAFYTLATNSWTAGPNLPNSDTASDDPGAMLPNGHVLISASPLNVNDSFPSPTRIYDYDPIANSYTNVTPNNGFFSGANAFEMCMLVLPTGQVLVSNEASRSIWVYTPTGSPDPSWQPVMTGITSDASGVYTLTGKTLNGISEGAGNGDDDQMASNYPIIRITDSAGTIRYATAFNWSSTSVTLGATSSVNFTLPSGMAAGPFTLTVIANGISSAPTAIVLAGAGTTTTLKQGANSSTTAVVINGTTAGSFTFASTPGGVIVLGDSTDNTININQNFGSTRPLVIDAGAGDDLISINAGSENIIVNGEDGDDEVDISPTVPSLANVPGNLTFNGGNGSDTLVLPDNLTTAAQTYTDSGGAIPRAGAGTYAYGSDVESVLLTTGSGADTVNINSTPAGSELTLRNAGGSDRINIGSGGSTGVASILGPVTIAYTAGSAAVNIDDTGDSSAHSATIDVASGIESITNLAPAAIQITTAKATALLVRTDAGNTTLTIARNSIPLTLAGNAGGIDAINIGSSSATGIQGITSSIAISMSPAVVALNIDDTGDSVAQGGSLGTNSLSSLSPGTITWDSSITSINVTAGSGNDNLTVAGTTSGVTSQINAGDGSDTLNINQTNSSSPVVIAPSTGDDAVNIATTGFPAAALFNTTQRIGSLTIANGGSASLQSGGNVVLTITSLALGASATLDLADGALIDDYTGSSPSATIRNELTTGFNSGAWNGAQIASSAAAADSAKIHALGYAEASQLGISTFRGQAVDTTALIIAYTKYGDSDLDGAVTNADFGLFIDGAQSGGNSWYQGDYNYDNKVDLGNDYALFLLGYLA